MAKRKRLTPPNPGFADAATAQPGRGPFSPPPRSAPIADVAREAAATAALDEVTDTLARARNEGRMVLALPLEAIVLDHLVRDRITMAEAELQALMQSLKSRGQQTPVEVMDLGGGRYGLISGWRRCQALARLARETGEARFTTVLALLRRPDQADDAYLAMVEENEIRVGLSYYERARIVVKAVEQTVFETEKAALQRLFANASRAKRSKVGSFTRIVHALDGALHFPEAIGERAGLALVKALDEDAGLAERLRKALGGHPPADAEAEQALIDRALSTGGEEQAQALPESDPGEEDSEMPVTETEITGAAPPAAALAPAQPPEREVARDVWLRSHPNGDLILTGAGLTPAFRAELRQWLKSRGA